MFRQNLVYEVKGQEDRLYRFECHNNAPIGEVLNAVLHIKEFLEKKMEEVEKQAKEEKDKVDCQECKEEEKCKEEE